MPKKGEQLLNNQDRFLLFLLLRISGGPKRVSVDKVQYVGEVIQLKTSGLLCISSSLHQSMINLIADRILGWLWPSNWVSLTSTSITDVASAQDIAHVQEGDYQLEWKITVSHIRSRLAHEFIE